MAGSITSAAPGSDTLREESDFPKRGRTSRRLQRLSLAGFVLLNDEPSFEK